MRTLRLCFLILSIFICSKGYAQKKAFNGRVVDEETNKPLEFVSVYVTNSTIGTLTNETGNFSLLLEAGKYEVVVSMVGYDPIVHPVIIKTDETAMAPVLFKIPPRIFTLDTIAVTGKRDASWYANVTAFKEYFLGKSAIAQKCILQNPKALVTEFNVEKQTLTITAKEPLRIQNPELGYNINFLLIAFIMDRKKGFATYLGYPHFELMDGTESQKQKWAEKRLEVYQGSAMHFARALRNKQLQQEGFRVARAVEGFGNYDADFTYDGKPTFTYAKQYEDVPYSEYLSFPDNEAKMEFKGPLRVTYIRKMEDLDYVYSQKILNIRKASYQTSVISLKDKYVLLDKNGRFEKPLGIVFDGYWSWDKVGDMLPFDYNPPKE